MAESREARVPDIGSDAGIPVIELLVKVGDEVVKDQGLVTLESDKATMEVPAPFAGTVRELRVKVGDEIGTGAVVAMIEAAGAGDTAAPAAAAPPAAPANAAPPAAAPVAPPAASAVPQAPAVPAAPAPSPAAKAALPAAAHAPADDMTAIGNLPYASPAVRVFARELGVDLAQVRGSERGGRIGKDDVQAFVKAALSGGAPRRGRWRRRPAADPLAAGGLRQVRRGRTAAAVRASRSCRRRTWRATGR